MRLPKNHTRVSLVIFGIVIVAMIFASVLKALTNNTFAETEHNENQGIIEPHFVTIYDQGKKLTVKTLAVTVGEVLEKAGYKLAETDKVEPERHILIDSDNFHINIYRSRPVMIVDGKIKKYIMTASYDPRTIAEEAGLFIYDGDEIALTENSNFLETGATTVYKVLRGDGETITVESDIPFTEEIKEDSALGSGEKKVVQEGEVGRKVTRYSVQFVDGVEVSRQIISEDIIKPAVTKITKVGSKQAISNIPPEWETCASWARHAGVSEADLSDALTLIYHESGCRVSASNSYSGAYGIPQALPGSKMSEMGSDWETNPVTQIRWMANYVTKRYGGWSQALAFWWCTGTCNGTTKSGHWY